MSKKINQKEIEKLAILIALEAEKKSFPTFQMLVSRAGFLSRPLSERDLKLENIRDSLKELTKLEPRKPPEITQKGKKELYDPKNRDLIIQILGKSMEDIGNQFLGYGGFMDRLTQNTPTSIQSPERELIISSDEFEIRLREIYHEINAEESRFHGLLPLDLIKKKIILKIPNLTSDEINRYLLMLEEERIIDLQIAYDASSIKEPEFGIEVSGRGLIYFLKYRSSKEGKIL
ncbi:MAG: hypothetical protein ACFE9L_20800 [Candidatus Hodarchaeota archaeon]